MFWLVKLPKELIFVILSHCDVKSMGYCVKALKSKPSFWKLYAKQLRIPKIYKTWQGSVRTYNALDKLNFIVPWFSPLSGFQTAIDTLEITDEMEQIAKLYKYYTDKLPHMKKIDAMCLRNSSKEIAEYGDIPLIYTSILVTNPMKIVCHRYKPQNINTSFSLPWSVYHINYGMEGYRISKAKKGCNLTLHDVLLATKMLTTAFTRIQYNIVRETYYVLELQLVNRK